MTKFAKWSKQNWLVWAVAAAYLVLTLTRPAQAARAAVLSVQTFVELIATLVTVFVFVGLFQVWITDDFVMKHLGDRSGLKGLALGAGLGTILHGPLIGVFPPLLRALLAKGAKVGVVVAIVSTWAIKLPMIPLEIRLFGWKFALLRNGLLFASAFIMAPLMNLALESKWVDRFRGTGDTDDPGSDPLPEGPAPGSADPIAIASDVEELSMKKIVLPTDGSANAVSAGRFAADLALAEGAEVLVVSVAEPAAYPGFEDTAVTAAIKDYATSVAQEEADRLRAQGVPVETLVVESEQAYDGILKAAIQCDADVIVMGTHGRGALTRALIGSVADKIVRHASIPVLLVPSTSQKDEQGDRA